MVGRVITEDGESRIKHTPKVGVENIHLLVKSGICVSFSEANRVVNRMSNDKLETLLCTAELKLELKTKGDKK